MPQKSHRIAAQQANVRKRRKKLSKRPPTMPPLTLPKGASTPTREIHLNPEKPTPIAKRHPEMSTTLSKLVRTELVRISLLMGAIFIILVIVSIILS